MAQPIRYDIGPCEVEVCELGEADLQSAFIMCSKNPGHKEFVPIDKFTREHIPDGYQNSCLVDLIKVLSDLTVRVAVRHTSEDRPQMYPDSDIPFPFYGQVNDRTRTGSGWVWNVEKFSQMYDLKTCPCEECSLSLKPKSKWAEIVIASAAHVVFDDKEGKHTTCHLFYDRGSSPDTCDGVLSLSGMSRVDTNIKEDKCKMTYPTHDMDLADRLENLTKRFVDLQKELSQKYNSHNNSNDPHPRSTKSTRSLSRIRNVGSDRSKNITSGVRQSGFATDINQTRWNTSNRIQTNNDVTDNYLSRKEVSNKLLSKNVHSIAVPTGNVRNDKSHVTLNRPQLRSMTLSRLYLRNSSPDSSQSGIVRCGMSQSRISISDRPQINHILPDRSQARKITTERSLAIITTSDKPHVALAESDRFKRSPSRNATSKRSPSRNITSKSSPSRNPISERSPPRNATSKRSPSRNATSKRSPSRNATSKRSPSRNVISKRSPSRNNTSERSRQRNVTSKRSPARNDTPKRSPSRNVISKRSPSRNNTSERSRPRNVTSKRSPSRNTTLTRSPSRKATSKKSPSRNVTNATSQSRNVAIDRYHSRNVLPNISQLNTVTADRSRSRIITPHRGQSKNMTSSNTRSNKTTEDDAADSTLTVIVSHPHGCNKQITIGYYTKRVEVKDSRNLTKYVYNTATCPGSSGAPVYVIGRWRGWWPCDHPHSGNCMVDNELNFSGVGLH